MNIDTTFYDERIEYYKGLYNTHGTYRGFGPIEFYMNSDGLRWILNFWTEAKVWYIKKEQERIAREEGKKT